MAEPTGEHGRGFGMTLAVQAVDDHAGAHQDEKERPIFPEDRPGVEVGQPAPQQQEGADGD